MELGSSGDKVGVSTANRIAEEIIAAGWPVGRVLGSEADLMARYAVSRGGMREAIRLLEQQGIANMKRGRGGGLVVTEPGDRGIVRSMITYLNFRRVLPSQLLEARKVVELSLLPMVVDRMSNENERAIRAFLEREVDGMHAFTAEEGNYAGAPFYLRSEGFHTLLARLTGNPVLELFVRCMEALVGRFFYSSSKSRREIDEIMQQVHVAHERIGDALIRRDLAEAQKLFSETLDLTVEFHAR